MENLAIHSKDNAFLKRVQALDPDSWVSGLTVHFLGAKHNLSEFLKYDIPELVILHLDLDHDDYRPLFQAMEQDPWLSAIGFILITQDSEKAMEVYQGFNISYFLEEYEVERNLGRVVAILSRVMETLTSTDLIKKLTALSGELLLDTDLLLVQYYAAFFSNYLYKEGYVSKKKKFAVDLTLRELLLNAMEHGNAGITYQDKTQWLESHSTIQDLLEERMARAPYKGRKVRLHYHITPPKTNFVIVDEGDGFDTTAVMGEGTPDLTQAHGRGIHMSRGMVDQLFYNKKGNGVNFEILHDGNTEKAIPAGFVDEQPRAFAEGETVFSENESGDFLYYIVSGEYSIYMKGKKIATVTPSDLFLGEMSFLLGNRRTATVTASKEGKLVEISREAFMEAVKKYPSYAIFLSKLLARRLRDANTRYAGMPDFAF